MSAAAALIAAILGSMLPAPTDNGLRLGLEGVLPVHDRISMAFGGTEVGLRIRCPAGPGKLRVWAAALDEAGRPDPLALFPLLEGRLLAPGLLERRFFLPDHLTSGGLVLLADFRSEAGRWFAGAPVYVVFAELPPDIILPVRSPVGIATAVLVSSVHDG